MYDVPVDWSDARVWCMLVAVDIDVWLDDKSFDLVVDDDSLRDVERFSIVGADVVEEE